MLEQVLRHLRNFFVKEMHSGDFVISDGQLEGIDFLQEGQYFRIIGSVFNDGVYVYPANDLKDEQFSGAVWAMAVPPAVIAITEEIEDWVDKYGEAVASPYTSESFGGYSYSKSTGGGGANSQSGNAPTWQSIFASRLNVWRKI